MNDHAVFVEAVDPHLEALLNIARSLVRDRDAADDLFQETCLRAFAGFGGARGHDMRAWLVAIMMNAWRMDLRRARSRPVEDREDPDDRTDRAADLRPVDDLALACLDRDLVVAALGTLPEPARVCLVLTDIGGLTAQEAADVLGCPRGTVLARVHRARRTLAQVVDRRAVVQ